MYSSVSVTLENLLIYNKLYSLGIPNTGPFLVTLTCSTEEPFDLNKLVDLKNKLTKNLNGAILIQNDDPYLIQLIEPKSGNTVHNLLNSLREEDYVYRLLGTTQPPDTRNGYKVYVVNSKYITATMEGLATFILNHQNMGYLNTRLVNQVNIKNTVSGLEVHVQ